MQQEFDELTFFASVKRRPAMYLGEKSLRSLRDQLFGMDTAFSFCGKPEALHYFHAFIEHYQRELFKIEKNGYACWWNHILYTSGNFDSLAFDSFYRKFESFLKSEYDLSLPELP